MPGIRRESWAILRNPAVVAALIGATVAGIFGIIQIVISPGYFNRHGDARTERPIDVDSGSVATRLGNAELTDLVITDIIIIPKPPGYGRRMM